MIHTYTGGTAYQIEDDEIIPDSEDESHHEQFSNTDENNKTTNNNKKQEDEKMKGVVEVIEEEAEEIKVAVMKQMDNNNKRSGSISSESLGPSYRKKRKRTAQKARRRNGNLEAMNEPTLIGESGTSCSSIKVQPSAQQISTETSERGSTASFTPSTGGSEPVGIKAQRSLRGGVRKVTIDEYFSDEDDGAEAEAEAFVMETYFPSEESDTDSAYGDSEAGSGDSDGDIGDAGSSDSDDDLFGYDPSTQPGHAYLPPPQTDNGNVQVADATSSASPSGNSTFFSSNNDNPIWIIWRVASSKGGRDGRCDAEWQKASTCHLRERVALLTQTINIPWSGKKEEIRVSYATGAATRPIQDWPIESAWCLPEYSALPLFAAMRSGSVKTIVLAGSTSLGTNLHSLFQLFENVPDDGQVIILQSADETLTYTIPVPQLRAALRKGLDLLEDVKRPEPGSLVSLAEVVLEIAKVSEELEQASVTTADRFVYTMIRSHAMRIFKSGGPEIELTDGWRVPFPFNQIDSIINTPLLDEAEHQVALQKDMKNSTSSKTVGLAALTTISFLPSAAPNSIFSPKAPLACSKLNCTNSNGVRVSKFNGAILCDTHCRRILNPLDELDLEREGNIFAHELNPVCQNPGCDHTRDDGLHIMAHLDNVHRCERCYFFTRDRFNITTLIEEWTPARGGCANCGAVHPIRHDSEDGLTRCFTCFLFLGRFGVERDTSVVAHCENPNGCDYILKEGESLMYSLEPLIHRCMRCYSWRVDHSESERPLRDPTVTHCVAYRCGKLLKGSEYICDDGLSRCQSCSLSYAQLHRDKTDAEIDKFCTVCARVGFTKVKEAKKRQVGKEMAPIMCLSCEKYCDKNPDKTMETIIRERYKVYSGNGDLAFASYA